MEMGLTAVTATQLWHHLYLGGGLCDLPVAGASGGRGWEIGDRKDPAA
jgi:hypothetical protein